MITSKPGIIVRLSNLIVVQVLFIFVALALILFVPEPDQKLGERMAAIQRRLFQASGSVVSYQLSKGFFDPDIPSSMNAITNLLDSLQSIDYAAVLRLIDSSQIEVALAYRRVRAETVSGQTEQDVSDFCNYEVLRLMTSEVSSLAPQTALDPRHIVSYQMLADNDQARRSVLVMAIEHGLNVSPKSNLQYTIFVLFLFSALVSLLTVHLLRRKFKRPLDRIIAGFAETAGGKLHNLAELESDPELGKLVSAYNTMARDLWANSRELSRYFDKLERANLELRKSQSFFTTLIDSSPLSIIVTDSNGQILIFNRAATEMFGCQAESVVGRPITNLLTMEPEHSESIVEEGDRRSFEALCRRPDGQVFPGYVITSRVQAEPDGPVARLYVCRDITDSKDFQKMMIRLDRYYTRGEMVGDIAHEINNHLAVLLGNVELMPLLLKKGDMEKVEKKLEVMKTSLEKIARFSDGLLDSAPDTVRLEPASINQIIENVIAFLQPQNKFDTVQVEKELSHEIPVIRVDLAQIQQLLVNLISNAAESLEKQAPNRIINVSTRASECDGQPWVELIVKDNGPGVVADKKERLFESRFTTKPRGHGIGLITCRKIVDNHGGNITYAYEDGAVFTVRLPVGAGKADCSGQTPKPAARVTES